MLRDAGTRIVGGTHLFRLAEHPEAPALFQRLGEAGLLVRSFDYHSGWLRFGIPGDEAEWLRLAKALA
jgi:cobalamin biosynthetic protein CobC